MANKLTKEERDEDLQVLLDSDWMLHESRDAICKQFKFRNFVEAFSFMTASALYSEKWNHHPEWSNVYNSVEVLLTTHDANGLTVLDVKLARKMDQLAIKQ